MSRQNREILFFLRHNNDVDHVTPVIYAWAQRTGNPAHVILADSSIRRSDFRLQLLDRFENVHVHRLMRLLHKPCSRIDEGDVNRMFKRLRIPVGAGCVCLDWVHSNMPDYVSFAGAVARAARRMDLAMVCLPHGDSPHANRMLRRNEINYEMPDIYAPVSMFDMLVVPNPLCAERYRPHLPDDRIRIAGSPRFNNEWLDILNPNLPRARLPRASGKLKIAIFTRNIAYPIFWDELLWSVKMLAAMGGTHVMLKDHTRDPHADILKTAYPEFTRYPGSTTAVSICANSIYSGSVIRWADVVVDLATSMTFEAVALNKPVLCPEYLHATRSAAAELLPSTVALCRDQLYDAVASLRKSRHSPNYTTRERKRFMREIVHVPDARVLDRYVQLLHTCSPETSRARKTAVQKPALVPAPEDHSLMMRYARETGRRIRLETDLAVCRRMEQQRASLTIAYVRSQWRLLAADGLRKVYLFPGGKHTRWLLQHIGGIKAPSVLAVLDDAPPQDGQVCGIQALSPEKADHSAADAIVLSADTDQAALRRRISRAFGTDLPLVDLYEGVDTAGLPMAKHHLSRARISEPE